MVHTWRGENWFKNLEFCLWITSPGDGIPRPDLSKKCVCFSIDGIGSCKRHNWPNSQIPQCTCSISHKATFRTEMCTFLFWMLHCGIWNRCHVGYRTGALRGLWDCFTLVGGGVDMSWQKLANDTSMSTNLLWVVDDHKISNATGFCKTNADTP